MIVIDDIAKLIIGASGEMTDQALYDETVDRLQDLLSDHGYSHSTCVDAIDTALDIGLIESIEDEENKEFYYQPSRLLACIYAKNNPDESDTICKKYSLDIIDLQAVKRLEGQSLDKIRTIRNLLF